MVRRRSRPSAHNVGAQLMSQRLPTTESEATIRTGSAEAGISRLLPGSDSLIEFTSVVEPGQLVVSDRARRAVSRARSPRPAGGEVIKFIPRLRVGIWHKLGNHSAEGKRGGDHQSHGPVLERGHRARFHRGIGHVSSATVARSDSADAHIVCPLSSRGCRQRSGPTGCRYDGSPVRQRANIGAHT